MEQTYFAKIKRAAKSECMNHRKIRLIILIVTVAAAMFEIGEYGVHEFNHGNIDGEEAFYRIATFGGYFGIFLMFVAAFFGAFSVYGIFRDLTSRQTADVQLSLPLSAKDRYLSKILAVAKLHILPLVIAGAVVTVIANAIHSSFDLADYLLRYHTVVLAVALFVDAISIFCMCCCGAKAEGVYTSIITGLCVSLTPYLFFTLAVREFSRVSTESISYTKIFSLFGGMVFIWQPDMTDDIPAMQPWLYLMGNILMSCLLIFASFFIYRRRDGRQVGKPMVYELFMELFMFIGLFTLFTIFFYTGGWGIGMTIAVIIYLIIRIVSARAKITPKLFLGWVLKYAASLAVFVVIMGAAYFTGGFGYYKMRQVKVDTNEVSFDIDITDYKFADNHISTNISHEGFYNVYIIDPHGDRLGYISDRAVSYTVDTAGPIEEKLDAINRFIDKNYTLDDRSMSDFIKIMMRGSIMNRYERNREGTFVSISIWNRNNSDNVYHSYDYTVDFWMPRDKYIETCTEMEGILERTDNRIYDDFDWEIFDKVY